MVGRGGSQADLSRGIQIIMLFCHAVAHLRSKKV